MKGTEKQEYKDAIWRSSEGMKRAQMRDMTYDIMSRKDAAERFRTAPAYPMPLRMAIAASVALLLVVNSLAIYYRSETVKTQQQAMMQDEMTGLNVSNDPGTAFFGKQ